MLKGKTVILGITGSIAAYKMANVASMLPGFADFNAKNNKKNLHDCNEYMNNDELRNTLKQFSSLMQRLWQMQRI